MTGLPRAGDLVTVVGGGRMGAGIAQVCAAAGHRVVVVESDDDAAAGALGRVAKGLAIAAERSTLAEPPDAVADRVEAVTLLASIPADTALLVEAVPEVVELKIGVLGAVGRAIGASCLVATNTSSLPIGELAAAVDGPERFVGMHFFNPVPVSSLVEVVVGADTSDEAVAAATAWAERLGKQSIVVRDSPGFATSRLGLALGLEAIRMLEEGVADAASIDKAMELGYRHPMGPLRSSDLVGLDVRLAIAEHLARTLGDRFAPPQLLRSKVEAGELGRKACRGFYDWT